MSDHPRNGRKIAARIVPIAKLDLTQSTSRRANPAPVPAPHAPASRPRGYGMPLAAATRLPRSLQRSAERSGSAPASADGTRPLEDPGEVITHVPAGRIADSAPAREDSQEPMIIWEQPPQPRNDTGNQAPRWMINPSLAPTEAEYAALASQVGSVLAGFAEFARSPGVVESGNWQARLDMPDTVLPETILEMQVTPSHAKLRFETEHQVSRAVLFRYAEGLQLQVKAALDDARVVEVMLW